MNWNLIDINNTLAKCEEDLYMLTLDEEEQEVYRRFKRRRAQFEGRVVMTLVWILLIALISGVSAILYYLIKFC